MFGSENKKFPSGSFSSFPNLENFSITSLQKNDSAKTIFELPVRKIFLKLPLALIRLSSDSL